MRDHELAFPTPEPELMDLSSLYLHASISWGLRMLDRLKVDRVAGKEALVVAKVYLWVAN